MKISSPELDLVDVPATKKKNFLKPDFIQDEVRDKFITKAESLKRDIPAMLDEYLHVGIVGIGGSQVQPYVLDPLSQKNVIHLEVPDPLGNLLELQKLDKSDVRMLYISRSGTTKEVLSFIPYLQEYQSLAVTNGGNLEKIAKELSFPTIEVSYDISGRFAIANELGLVPIIAMGLDPISFLESLYSSYQNYFKVNSIADVVAQSIYSFEQNSLSKMRVLPSGYLTEGLGILLTQLINESTAKKPEDELDASLHPMPRSAHSDVQRWYGGKKDSFIFSIRAENYTQDIASTPVAGILEDLVPGTSAAADQHLNITSKAVEDTFPGPVFKVILERDSLNELAECVGFFHALTVRLCQLKDSNPFNQPAVQEYKERASQIYENL